MSGVLKKALQLLIGTEPVTAASDPATAVPQTQAAVPKATKKPHKQLRRPFKKMTERELIQLESDIGARLFGEVPKGHRREFFNLDLSTWIWYDVWMNETTGQRENLTIRYEVHDNGILKVQEGARYDFLEGQELKNFMTAIQLYYERVTRELYHTQPTHARHVAAA